jgi:hypothetical protein
MIEGMEAVLNGTGKVSVEVEVRIVKSWLEGARRRLVIQEDGRRGSNPRPSEPQSADPCF